MNNSELALTCKFPNESTEFLRRFFISKTVLDPQHQENAGMNKYKRSGHNKRIIPCIYIARHGLSVEQQVSTEEGKTPKLIFEPKSDFKFSAAYEAYSKSFDGAPEESRKELNDAVQSLNDGKIGYPQFYEVTNRYIEGAEQGKSYRRARIEGQRKQ